MICILTSVETLEQAQYIAHQLIQRHLAACVQQTMGNSTYRWQGHIETSHEYYLNIKTRYTLKADVIAWLRTNHPYDVPEIITLAAEASKCYNTWLHSETSKA